MPKELSQQNFDEINYSAILNKYVYFDEQNELYTGETIKDIRDQNSKMLSDDIFCDLVDSNENIGNFELIYQSNINITADNGIGDYLERDNAEYSNSFPESHLIACAFRDHQTGDIYVAYRGTGDGKWVDNGEGMVKEDTLMQRAAAEFFDEIISKEKDAGGITGQIIVTGHSKGGNLAQYVTMRAENKDLIDKCYSIDGQGFSSSAITAFKNELEDSYEMQVDKMFSINGQNDYVHDLGIPIIKSSQTYFLETSGTGFAEFHRIESMFKYYEIDGEKRCVFNFSDINTEQGPLGKFVQELSGNMMNLPEEELNDCAISIMSLLEYFMDKGAEAYRYGTGDRQFATLEEGIGLVNVGIPLIINTIRNSDNADAVFALFGLNISKDHWLVDPIFDIVIHLSENMTIDELEGCIDIFNAVTKYAESHGMDLGQLIDHIGNNPKCLLEIYASLDHGKKIINEIIFKAISAVLVAKLILTAVFPTFSIMVDFVAALGIIYLLANHIVKNWDTICEKAELIADYVKDEIVKFYNDAKQAVQNGMNIWLGSVCTTAEKYITKGARVVNKFIDGAADFWDSFKEKAIDSVKTLLYVANPLIYIIASKVYKANKEPVRINIPRIRDCVDRMNNLARRVANIDSRLDNLYWRLAQNNIEKEEGIFTSLANMYNLFRADLNVDEGAAIKRKARALSDLYDGYESTEKWVMDNVPQKI